MRYFFEVGYNGTRYAGFQVQKNANTIQAEVEKALKIYFKTPVALTGSSRTDAGVHSIQNYFHGDIEQIVPDRATYSLNAILPSDIVLKNIIQMPDNAHCRFDALSREYHYHIYFSKDPFMVNRAYYYPYELNHFLLNKAAKIVQLQTHFQSFSKKNSQAKTDFCKIEFSEWFLEQNFMIYKIRGNRFLRGMVRALVATMLRVGREKLDLLDFENLFHSASPLEVDFSAPPQGLYLSAVTFPSILLEP